jgi:hypothetical protein
MSAIARTGEIRNVYKILVRKTEKKRPLVRLMRRWNGNIKMDPKETRCNCVYWIHLV